MATPNYGYEKRQRELAKKRKAEEKKQKKAHGGAPGQDDHAASEPQADHPTATDTPPPAAG